MKITNDGLTLWYGTPDAIAPPEDGADRIGLSLNIGVAPAHPANAVTVRYAVDGGQAKVIPAVKTSTDYGRGVQYFRANFPPLPEGECLDYAAIVTCGGRQSPPRTGDRLFQSRARLAAQAPANAPHHPAASGKGHQRFSPRLRFITAVTAHLVKDPDILGGTPTGLRVNYYLEGGRFSGPEVNGRVLPRGADFLTVRSDGVGIVQVRATFETDDGALLAAEYTGTVDFGENGYARAERGELPEIVPLQLVPRFSTASEKYRWMNRHQFLGVGQARVKAGIVEYDLFAVYNDLCP